MGRCWRRLLQVPWTARRSNKSILKSWVFIGRTDAEAETPILWPSHVKNWLIGKDPDSGRHWGQEEKGTTEDEMAGWHHWLNGRRESEWTPGVGDGQGGLACCDSWGRRVGHDWATELNWTKKLLKFHLLICVVDLRSTIEFCIFPLYASVVINSHWF